MEIRIINGTYGKSNGRSVELIRCGESCEVDDAEAKRLVGLGVGAILSNNAEPAEEDAQDDAQDDAEDDAQDTEYTRESLSQMTLKELQALAAELGINGNFRKKDPLIETILSFEP